MLYDVEFSPRLGYTHSPRFDAAGIRALGGCIVVRNRIVGNPPANPKAGRNDHGFYADLDRSKRRPACLGCAGCFLLLLFLGLGLVAGGASLVAATGIVRLPLISRWVYPEQPQPVRVVEPGTPVPLEQLLGQATPKPDGTASLSLTESALTAVLREPSDAGTLPLKRGQVAIDADRAEIFGTVTLPWGGQPVALRLGLVSSQGSLDLGSLHVGYVAVPSWLIDQAARSILGSPLSPDLLARYGVVAVSLGDGSATLTLDLSRLSPDAEAPQP